MFGIDDDDDADGEEDDDNDDDNDDDVTPAEMFSLSETVLSALPLGDCS